MRIISFLIRRFVARQWEPRGGWRGRRGELGRYRWRVVHDRRRRPPREPHLQPILNTQQIRIRHPTHARFSAAHAAQCDLIRNPPPFQPYGSFPLRFKLNWHEYFAESVLSLKIAKSFVPYEFGSRERHGFFPAQRSMSSAFETVSSVLTLAMRTTALNIKSLRLTYNSNKFANVKHTFTNFIIFIYLY